MTDTQTQAILAHLETGAAITPLDALQRFGCFRLAARCHELRKLGWEISCEMVKTQTGKRIACYRLLPERDRAHRAAV